MTLYSLYIIVANCIQSSSLRTTYSKVLEQWIQSSSGGRNPPGLLQAPFWAPPGTILGSILGPFRGHFATWSPRCHVPYSLLYKRFRRLAGSARDPFGGPFREPFWEPFRELFWALFGSITGHNLGPILGPFGPPWGTFGLLFGEN